MNRMAAELALHAGASTWKGVKHAAVDEIRTVLETKARDEPEFWSVGGLIELRVYEALARRNLAAKVEGITDDYAKLYERLSAGLKWQSIFDTARLVLPKYAQRASPAEGKAARALLAALAGWAGGLPSP